ncbi:MAG: TRAP transporter substrate-binding protein [Eubacteriales bacterium]|nr:TRAP transporter substrate-binding protein [Eubacteriales bacterium]
MNRKKALVAFVVVFACVAITACGDGKKEEPVVPKDPILIKIGNTDTASRSTNVSLDWLAGYLSEQTEGAVAIEIYPGGELGDDPEMCKGLLLGLDEVYIGHCGVLGSIVGPKLDVLELPFLYGSYEEWVEGSFEKEGLSIYNELLEGTGYVCVDFMYNGMMNLCSNEKIYRSIGDFKDYSVRVNTSEINRRVFEALGAEPIPMAWGEVYNAVEEGTVDGLAHSLGVFNDFAFYEFAPYITLTEHQSSPYTVVMSTEFLDSMPPELRDIVLSGIHEACARQRTMERELELGYAELFVEKGATVHTSTAEEKAKFYAACEDVYKTQRDITSADIYDRFLATAGK